MSYAVRAWKDATGAHGITIGTVTAHGYDNLVTEIDLTGSELAAFMDACAAAVRRASAAPGPLSEPMPGAYESWEGKQEWRP